MKHEQQLSISVAGTSVELLGGRALYWPEGKMMCIADAHFGKAAAFRELGQPVPSGTTSSNLKRLDALIAASDVEHVVFLGDFLHAKSSLTASLLHTLTAWRGHYPRLKCTLVRGNHDKRAGDPPRSLQFDVVDEPYLVGPFALAHHLKPHPTHHVIAGHIHPVYMLRGIARQTLRLPCFVVSEGMTLVPSFGEFTGGYEIEPDERDWVFVTDGEGIWRAH